MADFERQGQDWGDDELDAIVADYFAMLDVDIRNSMTFRPLLEV